MNIFAVNENPELAARDLCDQHVCKMPVECLQMMVNPFLLAGHPIRTKTIKGTDYKIGHLNHPSSLWVRKSLNNWSWIETHAHELCDEYQRRYGKVHYSTSLLLELSEIVYDNGGIPGWTFEYSHTTTLPQCMPEQYKRPDAVEAYRTLYAQEKIKFARWRYSSRPEWIEEYAIT
jgi:hypothetical protein